MNANIPLQEENKITVTFRVEPGCLGPAGQDHIIHFCNFVKKQYSGINTNIMDCKIVPRVDKSLPELQYQLKNKSLAHDKAKLYLECFDIDIDTFEEQLQEDLVQLIDDYMSKQ